MRARPVLLLLALGAVACSGGGDDAATTSVREAGEADLVGVEAPAECHVMQGGWVLCGSSQDHEGVDRTRGGLCTEGRRDGDLRLVPEVVLAPDGVCPTYLEVPPGVSVVFTNRGDEPYEVTVEGVEGSGPIAPGGEWVLQVEASGQYVWRTDANEALTGVLEVKPLDEPPPVSTITPAGA